MLTNSRLLAFVTEPGEIAAETPSIPIAFGVLEVLVRAPRRGDAVGTVPLMRAIEFVPRLHAAAADIGSTFE